MLAILLRPARKRKVVLCWLRACCFHPCVVASTALFGAFQGEERRRGFEPPCLQEGLALSQEIALAPLHLRPGARGLLHLLVGLTNTTIHLPRAMRMTPSYKGRKPGQGSVKTAAGARQDVRAAPRLCAAQDFRLDQTGHHSKTQK